MRIHDGAYGTLLARHLHGDETADDLCLRDPTRVVDAHRAYLEAGATAIQTNSFLANRRGRDRRRRDLQHAAIHCAREAISLHGGADDALAIATIGPISDLPRDYWADLELVLDADMRAVQCETIGEPSVAHAIVAAWNAVAAGVTGVEFRMGCSVSPSRGAAAMQWVVELAHDLPPAARIGLNCCEGPSGLRGLLEQLCDVRPGVWVMPSAGLPTERAGSEPSWPLADPHQWADAVADLVDGIPVAAVGGCCGTTPASIAAFCSR